VVDNNKILYDNKASETQCERAYFFVVTLNLWPWSRPFCAMINDGVRWRSRPERELNYKQTHTHTKYTFLSLSPLQHTCSDGWTAGRIYTTRIAGPGEISRTVLFTSRFLSDFSSEHIIFFVRHRHRFINHSPLGLQWPPPPVATGRPSENPLIILLPPFFDGYTTPPLQTPLEGKTFSSGRQVEIHHATAVLFATRARNIFIRSHALLSPSVTTAIRLYHAYCPFVRFVYAHIYYIIYTQIYVQCVCFGRVFGLIIPPSIFSVCGNAKSFRSRLF